MKTILIIDDDEHIGNMLEETLGREGYGTLRAYSGTEALLVLETNRPDLVLLDLMLPGQSGEAVLRKIKDIPVIVVSAKACVDDKVQLLLDGAVDYVTKPFDMEELLARITVALRNSQVMVQGDKLVFEEISLDCTAHMASVEGQTVKLTKTEFAILKLLMSNPKQVIAKSVMLDKISMETPDCVEGSLKVHISNLRRKLKEINGKDYIEAVWGIGFKMREA
ncbi:MAG: response regulator transcription factor [Clostridium sp.]|nr:response regulator transcription factor [Clostridium sp.]MCM1171075.1 response regulator transcription factor [Clostridium sp.]MCM1207856.1 response regulator transcription factor [Ruminococcus sp.]